MIQDIELVPDNDGIYDLAVDSGKLKTVSGMQSSIVTSLFTDARAPSSIVPTASLRRGWCGDITKAIDGRYTGSTLWTLDQARLTSDTIRQAELAGVDALSWIAEDGVGESVTVDIERGTRSITISIEFKIKNNETQRYNYLWRNTNESGISNL